MMREENGYFFNCLTNMGMEMKIIVLLSAAFMLLSNAVLAEEMTDCAVHYTRTACAGQEAISYKKCNGEQSCVKYKAADSLEACQKAAMKACANDRLDITKMKVITATYQGQPITSATGADDFCLEYPNRDTELNKCPEDQ
ncbi:MAG: hypothetical protein HQL48_12075 [Gammaproteobacteria bacterium]|nr:hypothetical protein [Gammaproteobacteria bacterium]